jgi:hypothetical protein
MFTMHFLGDIHQPLHTEYLSRGGNDISVCFDSSCGRTNLHSVWDSFIPAKLRNVSAHGESDEEDRHNAKLWANEIWNSTKDHYNSTSGAVELGDVSECRGVKTPIQCALKWANESNAWICKYVLAKGAPWLREHDLAGEYFDGAAPVVQDMVTKGGLRLGGWMNALVEERLKRIGDLKAGGKFVVQSEELDTKWMEL